MTAAARCNEACSHEVELVARVIARWLVRDFGWEGVLLIAVAAGLVATLLWVWARTR